MNFRNKEAINNDIKFLKQKINGLTKSIKSNHRPNLIELKQEQIENYQKILEKCEEELMKKEEET